GDGLLLGRFRLSAKGVGSSVRLYRATRGEAALLRAWHEGGVPEAYRWGNSKGGGVEFLLAWAGEASAQSWPLRLELWRMRAASRFFTALAAGDGKTLAELVPDAALRARLPRGLVPEAACDSQNPDTSGTAIVAATVPLPSGARSPWSLWWSRSPWGWRLAGAAPVLE